MSGWTKLVERRVLISGATNDDGMMIYDLLLRTMFSYFGHLFNRA